MRQEIRIGQHMQQRIVMTPMLQQALKILQMSTLELQEWIDQEMVENPALEEEEETKGPRESPAVTESDNAEILDRDEREPVADPSMEKALESRSADMVEQMKKNPELSEDFWERYDAAESASGSDYEEAGGGGYDQEKRDFAEASLSREQTLAESLEWQLSMSALAEADRPLARALIGNLDENGYLAAPLDEIAKTLGVTPADAERVLKVVQSFDPPGVAARDLRECLLHQLENRKGPVAQRAYEIVKDWYEDFQKRRYPNLAKGMHLGRDELQQAFDLIAALDPKPGRNFTTERTKYITPDVYVVKVDGEWIIQLNDEDLPRLRVSPYYRKLLKGWGKTEEARQYLEGKIHSALWLIKNIDQRRKTLLKVSEVIFRIQRDFLEFGVSHLKPLTLKQVAEMIGMHESTVSRVTTHKYIQTPRGLYELKYFFTSGLESEQGLDVSSMSVKEMIKELVAQESSSRPYSDQRLTELLREKGIQIARRTVAKYREELRISSASQRRKL